MKKLLISMAAVMTMVVAGVAVAGSFTHKPSEAEVEKAIDSRLHAMLVKLNAEKK
jgi:hypothetical protein